MSLIEKKIWRRRLAGLALGSALAFGTVAAHAEMVLHRGTSGEPGTLDPHQASGTWENDIIGDLFLGLTTEGPDANSIPGAATDWKISDDGTVYTFNLRDGATWSDGVPVTAHDFVFAFKRILNPEFAAKYAYLLYPIRNAEAINSGEMASMESLGVKAIDDDTLEITLKSPTPFFIDQLMHFTAYPVPKHKVEELGDAWVKSGNMVSNGAYTLAEWVPQTHVKSVKNPRFYDTANVAIDTVYYYPTEDRSAALKRFRAGELDVNSDFPSEQIDFIRENLPDEARIAPYVGIYYYTINQRAEYEGKPNVLVNADLRLALSMAINRSIITDKVLKTGEIPAVSFVPPGMPNYEGAKVPFADMDMSARRAKARELMAAAGYTAGNPLELVLRYNTSEDHKRVAIAVAKMWEAINVKTELFNSEIAVHYNDIEQGQFQVARAGWIADYIDAKNFLSLLQTSSGPMNFGKYSNAKFDSLMDQADKTTDLVARGKLMSEAEQIALEEAATIPIYYYVSKALVAKHLEGYEDNVRDIHRSRWMTVNR